MADHHYLGNPGTCSREWHTPAIEKYYYLIDESIMYNLDNQPFCSYCAIRYPIAQGFSNGEALEYTSLLLNSTKATKE